MSTTSTNHPLFSIQRGYTGRERLAITASADWLGGRFILEDTPSQGSIPVGSVEYGEPLFGPHRKDFFPSFLDDYFGRQLALREGPFTATEKAFIKDALEWKAAYKSKVVPRGKAVPKGLWWVSEPVQFVQE